MRGIPEQLGPCSKPPDTVRWIFRKNDSGWSGNWRQRLGSAGSAPVSRQEQPWPQWQNVGPGEERCPAGSGQGQGQDQDAHGQQARPSGPGQIRASGSWAIDGWRRLDCLTSCQSSCSPTTSQPAHRAAEVLGRALGLCQPALRRPEPAPAPARSCLFMKRRVSV